MRTFLVTGRVPHGDNDVVVIKCESADKVEAALAEELYDNDAERKEVETAEGVTVYIDATVEVRGDFRVLSDGYGERKNPDEIKWESTGSVTLTEAQWDKLTAETADTVVSRWGRDTGEEVNVKQANGAWVYSERAQDIYDQALAVAEESLVTVLGKPPWADKEAEVI